MPKRISPESFFERARAKGSEEHSASVDDKEVKKVLQPKTQANYDRALSLWEQFVKLHPNSTPYEIEPSKKFVMNLALGIDGSYGDNLPGRWTVVQYYKDFTAGWRRIEGNEVISPSVTLSTSNYIKYNLYDELGLPDRKRLRRYGTMIHFVHLGTQLWKNDWFVFQKPGRRVQMWALIMDCVFTSARIGEYIESTCRLGTRRGLYYRDMVFGVFRNEHGNPEFALQVRRDAKAMTHSPNKRPEHSLHEGLQTGPLYANPILFHLAIFLAHDALRDYKTIDEVLSLQPLENEMLQIHWTPSVLGTPFFQGNSGEMETASSFSRHLRELGQRTGYICPPTVHDFRAEGLFLVDKYYSSSQRMKHGGQRDENTYRDYYAPNNPGTDGQGSYFGGKELRSVISDYFRSMTLSRNPELWQSLPAEKRHELENREDYKALEAELETLPLNSEDDIGARNQRKELQSQRRKLVLEELRQCRKTQAVKPSTKTGSKEETSHHRGIFPRARKFMPQRDRLASGLFIEARIRDDEGKAALQDLIDICSQDHEIGFHPGLELKKCHCKKTEAVRNIHRKPAAEAWSHVYRCYRKRLLANHKCVEFCFFCNEWFVDKRDWETHCQNHLDTPESISFQCNPLVYGGTLIQPGYCGWCFMNTTLPAVVRMRQFPDKVDWRDHIRHEHLGEVNDCKEQSCPWHPTEKFESQQQLEFHLQDVHCLDLGKPLKRSRCEGDANTRPTKLGNGRKKRPMDKTEHKEQEFQFVDESTNFLVGSHTTASLLSTRTKRSMRIRNTAENKVKRDDDTSSCCGESWTKPDELDCQGDDPNDLDYLDDRANLTQASFGRDASELGNTSRPAPTLGLETSHSQSDGIPPCTNFSEHVNETAQSARGAEDDHIFQTIAETRAEERVSIYIPSSDLRPPSTASTSTRMENSPSSQPLSNCPSLVEREGDRYVVEKLLDRRTRRVRGGKVITKYLVKWEGYSDEECTWEKAEDIDTGLIEEYEGTKS